jgi:hypothetical protein
VTTQIDGRLGNLAIIAIVATIARNASSPF